MIGTPFVQQARRIVTREQRPLQPTFAVPNAPIMFARTLSILALILIAAPVHAQGTKAEFIPALVGFWNIENLYDTLDSPDTDDREFLPESGKLWGAQRYGRKVEKMGEVIAALGKDLDPRGVALLGLAEVENRNVVEDLTRSTALKARGYQVVHTDSPDRRGVDVALIHDPKRYVVYAHKAYRLHMPDTAFRTRDQLLVSGVLDGDTTHVIVAHWPSRRGGEKRSMPNRMAAGELGRHIVDSLLARNPDGRILYMGDLNDDPVNKSITMGLRGHRGSSRSAGHHALQPHACPRSRKGSAPSLGAIRGTSSTRSSSTLHWSPVLVDATAISAPGSITNRTCARRKATSRDTPSAPFVGDTYQDGYSDHFPVYLILVRDK
jgi:endonuclease/exonuclease/phosphatase family metal-dependent hydrolase